VKSLACTFSLLNPSPIAPFVLRGLFGFPSSSVSAPPISFFSDVRRNSPPYFDWTSFIGFPTSFFSYGDRPTSFFWLDSSCCFIRCVSPKTLDLQTLLLRKHPLNSFLSLLRYQISTADVLFFPPLIPLPSPSTSLD